VKKEEHAIVSSFECVNFNYYLLTLNLEADN